MKISKEARRTSRQMFRLCMVDGKLDESRVRLVINQVVKSKPRGAVGMLTALAAQVRTEVENQKAIVESATELDGNTQAQLKTSLSQKYGRELALEFHLNPELLGGIRVRIGSDVWDGSVRARLESLKAQLA